MVLNMSSRGLAAAREQGFADLLGRVEIRRDQRGGRLGAPAAAGRPLGVRARSRRHHSRRICPAAPFPGRAGRSGARGQDRPLSVVDPGRAWRLAAVPRRRLQHVGQREGLLRAQDLRRACERAGDEAGARGDPLPRGRQGIQRLHPGAARALRPGAVARRAGDAGRDHGAAALVPVPPRQGQLLVAHRDRAAAGADVEAPAGAQQAQGRRARAVRDAARAGQGLVQLQSQGRVGLVLPRRRPRAAAHAGPVPEEAARALLSTTR